MCFRALSNLIESGVFTPESPLPARGVLPIHIAAAKLRWGQGRGWGLGAGALNASWYCHSGTFLALGRGYTSL